MSGTPGSLWQKKIRLGLRAPNLSLFHQIILGNAAVIVVGAVAGTLITRRLADQAASVWLILLFALGGIALTIGINTWIIWRCMLPFHRLDHLVTGLASGQGLDCQVDSGSMTPDIERLVTALSDLVSQLQERNRQLSALSERSIQIQEEERIRIARGLHDETGQSLTNLIITLEQLESRLADQPEMQQRLAAVREQARTALSELRKIIYDLRPTILDDLGLVSAIRWYARTYLETQGVQVRFFLPEEPFSLSTNLSTTLFRITQEAFANILRHACAKVVHVTLVKEAETVCLQIKDDGLGFQAENLSQPTTDLHKLGLLGIRERTELVGGQLTIDSTPGQGTRLLVCLPIFTNGDDHDEQERPAHPHFAS